MLTVLFVWKSFTKPLNNFLKLASYQFPSISSKLGGMCGPIEVDSQDDKL